MMHVLTRRFVRLAGALALAGAAGACNETASDADADASLPDVGVDVLADGSGADTGNPTIDAGIPNCAGEDSLSPNHAPDVAWQADGRALDDAALHACAGWDDWFAFDVAAGNEFFAVLAPEQGASTVELVVYRGGGLVPDDPVPSTTDDEGQQVAVARAFDDTTFFVQVVADPTADVGYQLSAGSVCADDSACPDGTVCSLAARGCVDPLEPLCGDDGAEPNNGPSQATVVTFDDDSVSLSGVVCEEDDDVFALRLDEPTTVEAFLGFDPDEDLLLYAADASGDVFASAQVDPEGDAGTVTLTLATLPAGDTYLVIDQNPTGLGLDAAWSLQLTPTPDICADDRDCRNEAGRPVCDGGACVPFRPQAPGAPGDVCATGRDCEPDLGCYEGRPGLGDNQCTVACERDSECAVFDDGYCLDTNQGGVCYGACSSDADCPTYFACDAASARCELLFCGVDADCDGDRVCVRSEQQNTGVCSPSLSRPCDDEDVWEPNESDGTAAPLSGDEPSARGATICDDDDDWYEITITEPGTRLEVEVSYDTAADLDVFVFDADGVTVGFAAEPDANPEVAVARSLDAGTYRIRVNQFPLARDALTFYTLTTSISSDPCTVEGGECLRLEPLRAVCTEEGACVSIEGNGELEFGEPCDSEDDCAGEWPNAFCWTRDAAQGANICTHGCGDDSDCDDVPGTSCIAFGGRFAVCLP